jgi:iron complex transport system substrate-binding protein
MTVPERIICLTEETVETLYLLGEQDRIVGITGYAVRPPEVRREKPKVSAFTSAKIDKILDLKPDLVLTFSDLQADIAAELIRHGIELHAFNQRSVDGVLAMIRTVGALVGATDRAERVVDQLRARVDGARHRSARLDRRPRVFFEEWDEPLISGIGWVSELIGIAGGVNVFADPADGRSAKRADRDAGAGRRTPSRHHHRLVVRQAVRSSKGPGATRLRQHSGCWKGRASRDQIDDHPAAGAGSANRRA